MIGKFLTYAAGFVSGFLIAQYLGPVPEVMDLLNKVPGLKGQAGMLQKAREAVAAAQASGSGAVQQAAQNAASTATGATGATGAAGGGGGALPGLPSITEIKQMTENMVHHSENALKQQNLAADGVAPTSAAGAGAGTGAAAGGPGGSGNANPAAQQQPADQQQQRGVLGFSEPVQAFNRVDPNALPEAVRKALEFIGNNDQFWTQAQPYGRKPWDEALASRFVGHQYVGQITYELRPGESQGYSFDLGIGTAKPSGPPQNQARLQRKSLQPGGPANLGSWSKSFAGEQLGTDTQGQALNVIFPNQVPGHEKEASHLAFKLKLGLAPRAEATADVFVLQNGTEWKKAGTARFTRLK